MADINETHFIIDPYVIYSLQGNYVILNSTVSKCIPGNPDFKWQIYYRVLQDIINNPDLELQAGLPIPQEYGWLPDNTKIPIGLFETAGHAPGNMICGFLQKSSPRQVVFR